MQIGIRLHDVNAQSPAEEQTLEARAAKARDEGFSCVHLALAKCIKGVTFDDAALTEGLGAYVRRVFRQNELDVAVLGCYLNLAHPDEAKLREFQSRYYGNIRVAALAGIGMVGTETGAPNAEYKLDANTTARRRCKPSSAILRRWWSAPNTMALPWPSNRCGTTSYTILTARRGLSAASAAETCASSSTP